MDSSFVPVFETKMVARWGDMDSFNHVNNSRYFTYFEQARIEWLLSLSIDYHREKTGPVIVTADCVFYKPIIAPANMTLKLFIGKPGRSSFQVHHQIFVDEVLFAEGGTKKVWLDYEKQQSIPFPDTIRRLFK